LSAEALDAPELVGVGLAVYLDGNECLPSSLVEVQCCRVAPGGTGLLVTGFTADLVLRCRALVRYVDACGPDLAAYYGLKTPPRLLAGAGHDLHIHVHGSHVPLAHDTYLSAAVVSLVGLVLGRRPPEAVAVMAGVDADSRLEPVTLSDKDLDRCRGAGIERVIVHPDSTVPEGAGRRFGVEIVRAGDVSAVLSLLFPAHTVTRPLGAWAGTCTLQQRTGFR
jgi:hypothetical protein